FVLKAGDEGLKLLYARVVRINNALGAVACLGNLILQLLDLIVQRSNLGVLFCSFGLGFISLVLSALQSALGAGEIGGGFLLLGGRRLESGLGCGEIFLCGSERALGLRQ